jgi:hypothetical protein
LIINECCQSSPYISDALPQGSRNGSQDGLKIAQTSFKMALDSFKMGPGWPRESPKRAKDGFKLAQDGSKLAQEITQDGSREPNIMGPRKPETDTK